MRKKIMAAMMSALIMTGSILLPVSASDVMIEGGQLPILLEDSEINNDQENSDVFDTEDAEVSKENGSLTEEDSTIGETYEVRTPEITEDYSYKLSNKAAKSSSVKRKNKTKAKTKNSLKKKKALTKKKTTKKRNTIKPTRSKVKKPSSSSTGTSTATQTVSVNTAQYETEVIELVNQERKKAGVSELTMDSDAMEAADIRANELVTKFSHTRPSGERCFSVFEEVGIEDYGAVGENIAKGQNSPSDVMNSWMNSSGHRENILKSSYKRIGVGCYQGSDGKLYWVQLFLTRHGEDD